jgi:ABC-type oligopeptide transport system substrate-binding subunit
MMKKLITFLLFFALAAAMLCGCGWNKSTAQTEGADGSNLLFPGFDAMEDRPNG